MADPAPPQREPSFLLDKQSSLRELFDGLGELHDQFQALLDEPIIGDTNQDRRDSVELDDGLDALRRELESIVLPEYQDWKEEERSLETPSSMQRRSILSLPIISKMEDHEKLNQVIAARGQPSEILLAESTTATVEMIEEEPEISENAGMTPATMVSELGKVLSKYAVPMGLMNKLMMLKEFEVLEFMIDDSEKMAVYNSDASGDTQAHQSRWEEAHERLKELIEILAYVPFHQITIEFLNRSTVISLERDGRDPASFLEDAIAQMDQEFAKPPAGSSLLLEKLTQSLTESTGVKIARWYFGDGNPEGGDLAKQKIVNLLLDRENPADNPITFVSITNVDEDVEWMKDLEEIAPYCSEYDDYHTEAGEVLRDQGAAMPYSKGFHLVGTLVAAMNPYDLDAMDESVPFTKTILDNLLGIRHTEDMYRHYFRCFQVAQRKRDVKSDADKFKKSIEWNYDEFLKASVSSYIPAVQRYNTELRRLTANAARRSMAVPAPRQREPSFLLDKQSSLRELFDGLGELHDQFQALLDEPIIEDTNQDRRDSVELDDGLDALRRELESIVLPEYQDWKEEERSLETPSSMQRRSILSLPIISKMEDHEKLNQVIAARGQPSEILLAESTTATVEMIEEEPELSEHAGMTPATMVSELGKVLSKYAVPMGLMNKLMMLKEFEVLEFMIDDSGSMALHNTVSGNLQAPQSRWQEAHERLKELIEILAYVPFHQITIEFLNRSTVISLARNGRDPASFLEDAIAQIDREFVIPPAGTSLFLEKLTQSLTESAGIKIARWYFGDGKPQGGDSAQEKIVNLVLNRENPADNPVTFVSITTVDEDVEWMKDLEEIAPYCSEYDDYHTEAGEVLRDQGAAMPYSKGFHLVGTLVAAMNPDDLDAMDESVPFTKMTLDNLLGIRHTEDMYRHYFRCFQVAQRKREVKSDADKLKKSTEWKYDEFLVATVSSDIRAVQRYSADLKRIAGY